MLAGGPRSGPWSGAVIQTTEIRRAARLLVLDPEGRVLLLLHADGAGRRFWAAPGGGVERAETTEQAARREAAEELGVTSAELTELWTGLVEFDLKGRKVSQRETFFLLGG